jgi:hypothetical protein
MDLDKNKLEKRIMKLGIEREDSFLCTAKEIDVEVKSGIKVSSADQAEYNKGWEIILMEPECGNYRGRYLQQIKRDSFAKNICSLGGECPHCSYEKINILKFP